MSTPVLEPSESAERPESETETRPIPELIVTSVVLSILGALTLGVVVAVLGVGAIQAAHVGCSRNRIDGVEVWSCPDGIAYAFPAACLVCLTGTVLLLTCTVVLFRRVTTDVRVRLSGTVLRGAGWVLAVLGLVGVMWLLVGVEPSPRGDYLQQKIEREVILAAVWAAAGLLLVAVARASRRVVVSVCAGVVLLLLACLLPVILLSPVLLILVAVVLVGVVLRYGGRDPRY